MVSIDLVDTLVFGSGAGISVVDEVCGRLGIGQVPTGPDNLVARALAVVGASASVRIVKRIPTGAGLGGGSSDAAAVLRWAGVDDLAVAARLGADVPFCVGGGRARVTGVGERVEPLPFEDRRFVLLLAPMSVATAAVYRQWDERRARPGAQAHPDEPGAQAHPDEPGAQAHPDEPGANDLEPAALEVAPGMVHWRRELAEVTGRRPRLAGSGSTWFVEGDAEGLGISGLDFLVIGDQRAPLVEVRTVPATSSA